MDKLMVVFEEDLAVSERFPRPTGSLAHLGSMLTQRLKSFDFNRETRGQVCFLKNGSGVLPERGLIQSMILRGIIFSFRCDYSRGLAC